MGVNSAASTYESRHLGAIVRPKRNILKFSRCTVGARTAKSKDKVATIVDVRIKGFLPRRSPKRTKKIDPKKKPKSMRLPKRARSVFEMHRRLYLVIQFLIVNSF